MCAFMTPILKSGDWDIHVQTKTSRRRSSDQKQVPKGLGLNQRCQSANLRKQALMGDTARSMSYGGPPTRALSDLQYIKSSKGYHLESRNSRTSFTSQASGAASPPKSPSSPDTRKSSLSNTFSKFPMKVFDKLRRKSLKKSPSKDSQTQEEDTGTEEKKSP